MMDEELKKLFMTIPDSYGKFSAIIQVSGFDTEEQAHEYLYQYHEVQKLSKFGMTNVEIADFFGCDESLIRKSYSEYLTKGRAEMKLRLRQLQWKSAEKGNAVMLIWLGKQILGQSDIPIGEDSQPLEWSID